MLKTLVFFLLICFLYKDDPAVDHNHVHESLQIEVKHKKRMFIV